MDQKIRHRLEMVHGSKTIIRGIFTLTECQIVGDTDIYCKIVAL